MIDSVTGVCRRRIPHGVGNNRASGILCQLTSYATLPEADLVQAVLKGKKPEKPPNMPAYEEKGINEEQAKALVAYMKSLKK